MFFRYQWDFSVIYNNATILLSGLWVTLKLTIFSISLGLVVAIIVTIFRVWGTRYNKAAAIAFIEVFRDLPVLALLIWLYYCLPIIFGDGARWSPFLVATLGLGLNFAALQAEIIRAGYESVPNGEIEAAKVLGFKNAHVFWYIIAPQTFWRSLAPSLGQVVNTLKLTSLASFIVVEDIFYRTNQLIQETYRPLELYTALAVLYLILILPPSVMVQRLERVMTIRFKS